jgi:hypothetical protein
MDQGYRKSNVCLIAILEIDQAVDNIGIIQVIETVVFAGHFLLADSGLFGDLVVIAKLIFTQNLIDELAACAAKFLFVKMQNFLTALFPTMVTCGGGLGSSVMDLAWHGTIY